MPATARILCLTAASGFAFVLQGAEPAALTTNSPFSPPAAASAPAAPANEPYEFAGVSTIGEKTSTFIYDKGTKKGRWIGVGETSDNISVVSYDSGREQTVVRINGAEKTLTLRKSTIGVGSAGAGQGTAGAAAARPIPDYAYNQTTGSFEVKGFTVNGQPAAVNGAQPVPAPAAPPPPTAPAPAPVSAAAPAVSAPAPAATTPGQPTAPPAAAPQYAQPGTIAYQEQEARMLVSDLLEIGIAQRRAYEAAQRKAAEEAAANHPSGVPQPTPPATAK